jgi:phage/plasmid-like protein (TIGR03299 family)
MSHGILENDKGAVGYVEKFGNTWHGLEQYLQFEGKVPMEMAERIGGYKVSKAPLHLPQSLGGAQVDGAFSLVREDTKDVLYPSVGNVYEVIQNEEILKWIESDILAVHKNITIESVGTLFGGQKFFVNLLIDSYQVNGDISETKQRWLITNPFGGKALTSCLHDTRVVCDNTVSNAIEKGKSNKTLRRFRHTVSASQKIKDYSVDLCDIFTENDAQKERFNYLASKSVNTQYIDNFLEDMFPTKDKEKRGLTIAQNKQEAILELYNGKDDLTAIADTRYKLLNAVTDWADHSLTVKGGDDQGSRFWSNIQGTSNDVKQQAFQLLLV